MPQRRPARAAATVEQRLRTQSAVTAVLAEAADVGEAAPRILEAICSTLGWDIGAFWTVDPGADALRFVALWSRPGRDLGEFDRMTRTIRFGRGIGLPGRVWASREPAWIEDVLRDTNFPRAAAAAAVGLHGAFGFPIRIGSEVLGVMEFYHREIRRPDRRLLVVFDVLGSQIGQYLERRHVEAAIRASEAQNRAILGSALDAIITIGQDGRVVEFNPAAERTFGWTRDEVLGREMAAIIVPPELRQRHRAGLRRVGRTGMGRILGRRIDLPALRRDGSRFPAELTITRVDRAGPPLYTGFVRDVADRQAAERDLRSSEARLRTVLDAMGEAVLVFDDADRLLLANPAGRALLGAGSIDVFGDLVEGLRGADGRPVEIRPGWPAGPLEARVPGDGRWLELTVHPIVGETLESTDAEVEGRTRRVSSVVVVRDVTAARETRAVREAFIGVLSHELRTPLTTIYGGTKMLRRDVDRPLPNEVRRSLIEDVDRESERLHRLVDDLLVLTRAEQGLELGTEPILLQRLLPRIVAATRLEPPAAVSLDVPAALPTVRGDPTYVEQVLRNLLSNAAKYGGGSIAVSAAAAADCVEVRVTDDGPGFPADEADRLFALFYRVPASSRRAPGAGIGLFVSRRLVEAMGGRIWATAGPDGGAEFGFALPHAEDPGDVG